MNIGFDVDGVIFKGILGSDKLLRYREKTWNRLLLNPVGKFLYRKLRHADMEVKRTIHQLKDYGHQIVIATYVFLGNEEVVLECLRENEIPYDKVFFPREGETPLEFKVRVILEQRCDYYVEDQPGLARDIASMVPAQVVLFHRKEDLDVLLS